MRISRCILRSFALMFIYLLQDCTSYFKGNAVSVMLYTVIEKSRNPFLVHVLFIKK